jgi:hypothetical protein
VLLAEAAKRELEHEGRRPVEPLDVVDRHHEWSVSQQRPTRILKIGSSAPGKWGVRPMPDGRARSILGTCPRSEEPPSA